MAVAKPAKKQVSPPYEKVFVPGLFVRRTLIHKFVLSGCLAAEAEKVFEDFLKQGKIKEVGRIGLAMSVPAFSFVR